MRSPTRTSTTSFLAAVKTALEDAGASTYTVEQDSSTKKIKITSNGGGGGGIFQLMWTDVASTAYDVLGFSNAGDDTGALTYTADNLRIHTSEFVDIDLGTSQNPYAFIMIGEKAAGIQISSTATLTLMGNATYAFSSPSYSQTLTYDDAIITKLKAAADSGLHSTALRYWRLKIIDRENSDGYVELSKLFLGDYYTPTDGSVQFPFSGDYVDFTETEQSISGQTFSYLRDVTETFPVEWSFLTYTEKEQLDTHFRNVKTGKGFFISFDRDAVFSSAADYYTRYVKFDGPPRWQMFTPGRFSSSWQLRELL